MFHLITHTHTHNIELPCTRDRPVAKAVTYTTLTRQTVMTSAGFEPAILATGRQQTYALEHAATETGPLLL